ncbi:hypothetical protein RND81_02G104200 [Saponaria officinalis]|uniref:Uncharacterized protein n=1 Tax=Saponaria officinalis TaxID=3572 RepID=A0AAW1MRS0_SAPOF
MAKRVEQHRQPQPQPPPDNLNAFKYAESRAPELDSLYSIISNRLNEDFRSRRNKRRRTTSFARKNGGRKKANTLSNPDVKEKKVSRRVRRRIELKENPHSGFGVSGDGTKRLRTHVWHAKRFTITKLWGFYLPLGLHGSGRGSRALLKWYKQGAVVHDASFYSVVQLKGSQEALVSVLGKLLIPSPVDYSEEISRRILRGESFGSAMLHHDGQDSSKAICPVTYIWRPFHQQKNDDGTKDERNNENVETESNPNLHQIWIWMHPSASSEGIECLKQVCLKMKNEIGVVVDCVSLDGQLGRIDVMGEGAFKILQKILHPLTSSEKTSTLTNCSMVEHTNGREVDQNSTVEKEECFSSHSVVSLKVVDPRLLSRKVVSAAPDAHLARDLGGLSDDLNKESLEGNQYVKDDVLFTLLTKNDCSSSLCNCNDLWDAINVVQPPVEEHHLCQERHKKSLDFFCLKDTSSSKSIWTGDNVSTACPILLMRHNRQSALLTGWSIVLPISWVKAFWVPLVSRGAHAIGLREKHWISCDVGLPYFPSDFPDCNAYSSFMASEAKEIDQTMECRPPATRPFKIPKLLPWNSRCFGFNEDVRQSFDIGVSGDHKADKCAESSDVPPSGSFEISVARTCGALFSFLKEISADHMLLFPKGLKTDDFSQLMKDETKISQASAMITLPRQGSRLCYLRVLLHAYKAGVFDEGAVVCSPRFSDISLWTSRSESDVSLRVPDAYVGSYFKEQSSGEWEFQLPEDSAAMEAYRRPIGFVTTGFVRGSKRPSTVGLCEALLLAQLRLDQWSHTPPKKRRKEIFVFVRNLRSTAYRLALATIVLEEQEDDVESL